MRFAIKVKMRKAAQRNKRKKKKKKMRTNERGSAVDRVRAGGEVREVGCRRSGK